MSDTTYSTQTTFILGIRNSIPRVCACVCVCVVPSQVDAAETQIPGNEKIMSPEGNTQPELREVWLLNNLSVWF